MADRRHGRWLMLPIIPIGIDIFQDALSTVSGWAWDKVVQGVFTWFAQGLMLLIEVVWNFLDVATTPHLTDDWFVNGVVASLAPIALFVTVAMMLMTAIQAALSGRPELIGDAVASGVRAIVGTAFTLVVMDTLIRFADVVSDTVWTQSRPDIRTVVDSIVAGVLGGKGWGATFLGPVALLLGMIGMLVTAVLLFMRSVMLYFVAGFAPLVWSSCSTADDARQRPQTRPHDSRAGAGQAGDRHHVVDRDASRRRRAVRRRRQRWRRRSDRDAADRVLRVRCRRTVALGGLQAAAVGGRSGNALRRGRWLGTFRDVRRQRGDVGAVDRPVGRCRY
ncbi:MAG: hypothetical protein QM733_04555 [Ilumatobacteraceae bacterium]